MKRHNNSISDVDLKKIEGELSSNPVKLPDGRYDVIVIDPPWPLRKIKRQSRPLQLGFDYPTMSLEQIKRLKIKYLCEDNSWIFVWTTQRFLPITFQLLKGWGLNYRYTMTWVKPGGFQIYNYPQFNTEFVVCGTYGKPKLIDMKAFNTGFTAPRGKHSEKPREFYETINRVCGGTKIDLFSRTERQGWNVWGNEVNDEEHVEQKTLF